MVQEKGKVVNNADVSKRMTVAVLSTGLKDEVLKKGQEYGYSDFMDAIEKARMQGKMKSIKVRLNLFNGENEMRKQDFTYSIKKEGPSFPAAFILSERTRIEDIKDLQQLADIDKEFEFIRTIEKLEDDRYGNLQITFKPSNQSVTDDGTPRLSINEELFHDINESYINGDIDDVEYVDKACARLEKMGDDAPYIQIDPEAREGLSDRIHRWHVLATIKNRIGDSNDVVLTYDASLPVDIISEWLKGKSPYEIKQEYYSKNSRRIREYYRNILEEGIGRLRSFIDFDHASMIYDGHIQLWKGKEPDISSAYPPSLELKDLLSFIGEPCRYLEDYVTDCNLIGTMQIPVSPRTKKQIPRPSGIEDLALTVEQTFPHVKGVGIIDHLKRNDPYGLDGLRLILDGDDTGENRLTVTLCPDGWNGGRDRLKEFLHIDQELTDGDRRTLFKRYVKKEGTDWVNDEEVPKPHVKGFKRSVIPSMKDTVVEITGVDGSETTGFRVGQKIPYSKFTDSLDEERRMYADGRLGETKLTLKITSGEYRLKKNRMFETSYILKESCPPFEDEQIEMMEKTKERILLDHDPEQSLIDQMDEGIEYIESLKNQRLNRKEMEYGYNPGTYRMLANGVCDGVEYVIIDREGRYPCAYIDVPHDASEHIKNLAFTNPENLIGNGSEIGLQVHGDISFCGSPHKGLKGIVSDDSILIGWDYGHAGDHDAKPEDSGKPKNGKRWEISEIMKDVEKSIKEFTFSYRTANRKLDEMKKLLESGIETEPHRWKTPVFGENRWITSYELISTTDDKDVLEKLKNLHLLSRDSTRCFMILPPSDAPADEKLQILDEEEFLKDYPNTYHTEFHEERDLIDDKGRTMSSASEPNKKEGYQRMERRGKATDMDWPCRIYFKGTVFTSLTAAYTAAMVEGKEPGAAEKIKMISQMSPEEARAYSKKTAPSENFKQNKERILLSLETQKFSNPRLFKALTENLDKVSERYRKIQERVARTMSYKETAARLSGDIKFYFSAFGSRNGGNVQGKGYLPIPKQAKERMEEIISLFTALGGWVRSGGSEGMDAIAENAAGGRITNYLPTNEFNGHIAGKDGNVNPQSTKASRASVAALHPNPESLEEKTADGRRSWSMKERLVERNYDIIHGQSGPIHRSLFAVCWTPKGKETGGSGQTMRDARVSLSDGDLGVPVFNLADDNDYYMLKEHLSKEIAEKLRNGEVLKEQLLTCPALTEKLKERTEIYKLDTNNPENSMRYKKGGDGAWQKASTLHDKVWGERSFNNYRRSNSRTGSPDELNLEF